MKKLWFLLLFPSLGAVFGSGGGELFTDPHLKQASEATRLVFYDARGQIITPLSPMQIRVPSKPMKTVEINGVQTVVSGNFADYAEIKGIEMAGPLSNVARIELQTRPYTWIEFKNVALEPRS